MRSAASRDDQAQLWVAGESCRQSRHAAAPRHVRGSTEIIRLRTHVKHCSNGHSFLVTLRNGPHGSVDLGDRASPYRCDGQRATLMMMQDAIKEEVIVISQPTTGATSLIASVVN